MNKFEQELNSYFDNDINVLDRWISDRQSSLCWRRAILWINIVMIFISFSCDNIGLGVILIIQAVCLFICNRMSISANDCLEEEHNTQLQTLNSCKAQMKQYHEQYHFGGIN